MKNKEPDMVEQAIGCAILAMMAVLLVIVFSVAALVVKAVFAM